jgi:chemotaxis signal transduction protein
MGLASIRGMLTPVYRLGSFLGYHADRSQPRWLALHGSGESVGLAFDAFEGQIAVSDSEVYGPLENESGREHVTGAVRVGDLQRAVIDLDSIVQAIRRRALESTPSKEQ